MSFKYMFYTIVLFQVAQFGNSYKSIMVYVSYLLYHLKIFEEQNLLDVAFILQNLIIFVETIYFTEG